MAGTNMETLLNKNDQQEAEVVMEFLGELDQNEKKEFLVFMQGIRFAKGRREGYGVPKTSHESKRTK